MPGLKSRLKQSLSRGDSGNFLRRACVGISAAAILIAVCAPVRIHSISAPALPTTTFDTAEVKALGLPDIPASVTSQADKARYTLLHFWDRLDNSRQYGNADRSLLEATFTGFIQLFTGADTETRHAAVCAMFDKAERSRAAFDILQDICFKYLYEPESPFYNEDYYIMVLQRLIKSEILSDIEKERPAYMLECALKNRPGERAADFDFEMPDGASSSLYDFKAPGLVMLFFDPDCLHCHKVIKELGDSPVLQDAVSQGRVKVLAIYPYEDREGWEEFVPSMPSGWYNGINPETIDGEQLYVFPVLPAIYLLDGDKKVLLKDARAADILNAIK